jgi:hypothetical protein
MFFVLGTAIDNHFHDHSFTLPYKILGGVVGGGAVLFVAKKLKGVVLR